MLGVRWALTLVTVYLTATITRMVKVTKGGMRGGAGGGRGHSTLCHWKCPLSKNSWRFSGERRVAIGNFAIAKKHCGVFPGERGQPLEISSWQKTSWRPMEKYRGAFPGKASSHRVELPRQPLAGVRDRLFLILKRARCWLVGSYQLDLKVLSTAQGHLRTKQDAGHPFYKQTYQRGRGWKPYF